MYITRGRSCMHEELFCIHMKELLRGALLLLLLCRWVGMLGSELLAASRIVTAAMAACRIARGTGLCRA